MPGVAAEASAMLGLSVAVELHRRAIRSRTPELVAALPPMWVRVLEALPEGHEHRLRLLAEGADALCKCSASQSRSWVSRFKRLESSCAA